MNWTVIFAALVFGAGVFVGAYYGPRLRDWYDGAEAAAERLNGRVKTLKKKAKAVKKAISDEEGPAA